MPIVGCSILDVQCYHFPCFAQPSSPRFASPFPAPSHRTPHSRSRRQHRTTTTSRAGSLASHLRARRCDRSPSSPGGRSTRRNSARRGMRARISEWRKSVSGLPPDSAKSAPRTRRCSIFSAGRISSSRARFSRMRRPTCCARANPSARSRTRRASRRRNSPLRSRHSANRSAGCSTSAISSPPTSAATWTSATSRESCPCWNSSSHAKATASSRCSPCTAIRTARSPCPQRQRAARQACASGSGAGNSPSRPSSISTATSRTAG